MGSGKKLFWIILATVVGEITLVLLTTIAQEVLFNSINYHISSLSDLVLGGLATFIAAVIAGIVASLMIKGSSYWPHLLISVLITTEMIYLMLSGALTSPVWFDSISGFSLIIGVWLGYSVYARFFFVPQQNFG